MCVDPGVPSWRSMGAPSGLIHPIWLKNDAPTASCVYQIGLPDDPDGRYVDVLPLARRTPVIRPAVDCEGGTRGLNNRYSILGSEGRRPAVGWTKRRPWLRSARARHRPSQTRVRLSVPEGLQQKDPFGSDSSSAISPRSRWPGGFRCSSRAELRPDRSVAVWLIAAVSTLAVIKNRGLYRSWVCSEFSRQAARIIAATAVGGFVLAASGWLVGSVAAAPVAPAAEGAVAAAAIADRAALAL